MELSEYFLTVGECAKVLGVSRVTVWRWTKEGRLNAQYIGREAAIPKWQVELMKEELKVAT